VFFWWLGRGTRAQVVTPQPAEAVDAVE